MEKQLIDFLKEIPKEDLIRLVHLDQYLEKLWKIYFSSKVSCKDFYYIKPLNIQLLYWDIFLL